MKKVGILFLCFLLCACNTNEIEEKTVEQKVVDVTPTPYVDNNPMKVGLYLRENGQRKKYETYENVWQNSVDIAVFSLFTTDEDTISGGNIKNVFNSYWNTYEHADEYKIGYQITYTLADQTTINRTILKPEDVEDLHGTLHIYVYDDVHQPDGAWYSHLETLEENSLMTSIKLTGAEGSDQIVSDLVLKGFTYHDENDFDSQGYYRGHSVFETVVKRRK